MRWRGSSCLMMWLWKQDVVMNGKGSREGVLLQVKVKATIFRNASGERTRPFVHYLRERVKAIVEVKYTHFQIMMNASMLAVSKVT